MELVEAYLARLGVAAEPPSVDALFRIHRAQVERAPYETLWIHLGERWGLDPEASARRIATGRGGYCYHLNGGLAWLLERLGYHVTRHVGGVHGPDGPTPDAFTNHLVLTVAGLPSDTNPGGAWYVDTGLGDALHDPLPLLAGTYRQGPLEFQLERRDHWRFVHDGRGSFAGMAWRPEPADMAAFAERHAWLSTSPESGFVRTLTLQRRDAHALDILRDLTLTRITADAVTTTTIETEAEWHAVFGDVFGLLVNELAERPLAELWTRRHAAHVEWSASRTSS